LIDLETISTPARITAAEAWNGTNVRAALKTEHAANVRGALLKMLFTTVKFLDCKKTLSNDDEVLFTFESLVADFPVFKITEWKYVTDGMKAGKYGKYYERLKASEFREAFIQYESEERSKILESQHKINHAVVDHTQIMTMMKQLQSNVSFESPQRKAMSGLAGNVKQRLNVADDKRSEIMQQLKNNAEHTEKSTAAPVDTDKRSANGTN